jgi:lipopolysaccharide assembly outer membrane protein LptD (OstA)
LFRPELAAAALAGLLLAACSHSAPAPSPTPSGPATPVPTPTGLPLHIISSGNGGYTTLNEMKDRRPIYMVRAKTFVADTTAGHAATGNGEFTEPHITFVDKNGAKTVADAPKAVLTSADKSVIMTGGVQARSQDGNVLSCDRLRYDGTTERIHGDGHVVMLTPSGLKLTGDYIDGDARLQNVRVYRK